MSKLTYPIFCFIAALFFTAVSLPAFAGGAGGSWGDDSGFTGNGGSFGGAGGAGSWDGSCYTTNTMALATSKAESCALLGSDKLWPHVKNLHVVGDRCKSINPTQYENWDFIITPASCGSLQPPDCPVDTHWDGSNCVKDLKCPAGYKKEANKCVWQCPAGMKLVGGNCVKDTQPEDCDPAIQQCDEDGKPKCNICEKLTNIINNQTTNINNDNRVISLLENSVTNNNTTNTSINNVNNNITTVNNNLTTINESINNLITTITENSPDFDTTALEAKIDEVITAINNRPSGGGGGEGVATDLTALMLKLEEMNDSIKANKYDDTELKAKIDELINKELDLKEITDRQDEQTGLLADIKRLLMPTNEAGDPSFEVPEVETPQTTDLWGAIRGFDIHQNRINAAKQCPADKEFTISLLTVTKTFAIPMAPMCEYLSYLAPIFLMLAYFSGAMIILKVGD